MKRLAARLAAGEASAFAELYDACADRLHRYLVWRLGTRDRAADVLQETFLRAVSKRQRLAEAENPIAYLFQIARNEATRESARRRRHERGSVAIDDLIGPDGGESPRVDAEVAAAAMARLEEADREIVQLKVFGELTFREIGELVGAPLATVATRYRRALDSLRPWLTKQLS